MRGAPPDGLPSREAPSTHPVRGRLVRWLPAASVAALTVPVLLRYGVSPRDLALFCAHLALGVALPGVLLVRALYGRARTPAEEIALGVVTGYALEVFAYVAARAAGAPLLVTAWPVATYAVFLAVPRLRRHWRSQTHRLPSDRAPAWWPWAIALVVAYLVVWSAVNFFRTQALTWPALGTSFVDVPFHLALVGELRHHVPPTVPTVAGEPLVYHWFVYAHLAAVSWTTGVEPLVLLLRLGVLPMLAALAVLLAAAGRRVTGSWPGALIGLVSTVLVTAPNLFLGTVPGVFTWKTVQSWSSPTQTFGAMFFAAIVVVLLDLLDRRRRGWHVWLLLGVLLVAVMGAKATYLPLLTAGLVAVAAVQGLWWLRPPKAALGALAMTAACLVFAQVVLFGGARQGIVVDPLSIMRESFTHLTGVTGEVPATAALGVTLLCLLCAAITWCGVLGLPSRPRTLLRPGVLLALGMGVAGLGAALLLGHPHLSQGYFLQAPHPYLAMAAAGGLVAVVRRARVPLRAVAGAVVAGVVAVYLIRVLCGVAVPLEPGRSSIALYLPYLALAAVVALAVVALRAAGQNGLRTWALVVCLVTAAGTPAAWATRVLPGTYRLPTGQVQDANGTPPAEAVPAGALAAGRWLRANSGPDDLVATNLHCRLGYTDPCDGREFWVAALTERRVLVESWTYTAANMDSWRTGQVAENLPFWDPERLRANDTVFRAPSAEAVRRLRDDHGVRWLFVNERLAGTSPDLGAFATLGYRSGDCAVYRLR
ncbi:hypothetical protein FHS43_002903 [Streptosporangium becharense]|uniref:Uncharacterized protein n=1 Tax=Streptosporangium becharense TaxID=1816182 RepID=A0A7W9MIT9_9ACTN|nr:hypothetical protein [Streptosporangium becharense]MBB2911630.1 hypothetical protein [Streptosporangium becharense]MBB5822552.1 hypothetical protein [Streptosporangium becharense]